jgi:hypothetical protein
MAVTVQVRSGAHKATLESLFYFVNTSWGISWDHRLRRNHFIVPKTLLHFTLPYKINRDNQFPAVWRQSNNISVQ